ncbi:MAG: hypothetical protein JNK61_08770 [Bacteroidia bacterium]|nr:hypothetical protein [Bacteroidia bacterium]HQV01383.1 hypothetical protein [Bacteroidia bacterium]
MKKLLLTIAILISAINSHAWVIQYANVTYATHPNCADGSITVQVWGTSIDIFIISVNGPNGTLQECKASDNFGSSYFTHTFNGLYPGAWHVEVW